jgi:ribA/ribD-fused uncharacterized protein
MKTIKFYKLKEPYGDFSNFSRFAFIFNGKAWGTSEHCYQASKYENETIIEKIRQSKTPRIAADLGRAKNNGYTIKSNWDTIKVQIMKKILWEKFTQNSSLEKLLLSTGNARIAEHTENDLFWGDGGDCIEEGKNMLGKVLMEIREELRTRNNKLTKEKE